jgi:TRAP-type mannitol/chloroaromatic compound transport system permease large subunit
MGALGGLFLASLYLSPTKLVFTQSITLRNPSVAIGFAAALLLVIIKLEEPSTFQYVAIPILGAVAGLWVSCLSHSYSEVWGKLRESVFLTAKATAMVCWLFIGSWTFASVFSYLGGHDLISDWVIGMDLKPWQFLVLAQLIIFFLGWPLEWSEILIIFVPIFLPLLEPFGVNPYFFAMLVALNLQTSFLTPPMAMSAYYLKGVLKKQIELVEIFKGIIPYLGIVILCMVLMYRFPAIALWFPDYLFGVYIP